MQYGNEKMEYIIGEGTPMFKSYYVVWKHYFVDKNKYMSGGFKSYYVVWKLFIMLFFLFASISFKSYYVVWKPDLIGYYRATK